MARRTITVEVWSDLNDEDLTRAVDQAIGTEPTILQHEVTALHEYDEISGEWWLR